MNSIAFILPSGDIEVFADHEFNILKDSANLYFTV